MDFYRKIESTTPKRQDVKVDTENKIHYIEFQNKANPDIPIEVRSIEYLGFSLTRGEKKQASNMWLINGQTSLLQGKTFSNYILTDERDHRLHPNATNVLYVDLESLHQTQTSSKAGELAGVLIGAVDTPNDRDVAQIFQNLKKSFDVFRNDTEARTIMTKFEELKEEGKEEGREEGRIEGKAAAEAVYIPQLNEKDKQIVEQGEQLVEQGEQLVQQGKQLVEKDEQLVEKDEQLAEQKKQLAEQEKQLAKRAREIEDLRAKLAKN